MSFTLGGFKIPNVKIPCELKKALHNQSYSLQLFWQDHHLSSICENVLCGINPNPYVDDIQQFV
jgi:hypothetical protein